MRAKISHIGSMPLSLPASTSLKLLPFPPHPNPLRPLPTALAQSRTALVTGTRGSVVVPVPSFCSLTIEGEPSALSPEPLGAALSSILPAGASKTTAAAAAAKGQDGEEASPAKMRLQVENSGLKVQRAQWGLTRALLANALHGVTEGHSVVLRLVGVGYRASVETDPFPAPDGIQQALNKATSSSSSTSAAGAGSDAGVETVTLPGSNWFSRDQVELYRRLVEAEKTKQEQQGNEAMRTPQRLNLRLGYSHPIVMPVPRGIECATPAPNRIVLRGNDKATVGLFASQIRRWRKPEPYKGKGIFVGDETIRLKTAKNK
ncbi:unnamed protein product [Tilletia controversa]|uniref:Large ribosomal subunit protein uL6 alpha-beta domain-containing protein n=3 Tax=Tilletia TaxID=13289 RepID=A0A8X7SUY9_9BASI|nr:hypothetical protein CF328_g5882 [Tilletia controversa]KAE8191559.1 hypothetical protein CF336_g4813 [Tilletia laevis]KAE8247840.1 hypothetical protein A4X03_0g6943 [Tilletia caries]KAE8200130.1 hypothetical protein CF335_g4021 [Tilletia laevis]KAE8242757.1 hypothetical protein A4X06_0g6770 [Tilletia controversa]